MPNTAEQKGLFVISIKRERRRDAPKSWLEAVRAVKGVEVQTFSADRPTRARITSTRAGAQELRKQFGDWLEVEEAIGHRVAAH